MRVQFLTLSQDTIDTVTKPYKDVFSIIVPAKQYRPEWLVIKGLTE